MITPLGGKTSLGTSPIIIAAEVAFKSYQFRLLALRPINTPEKAKEYRKLVAELMPETAKCMAEIGFPL